MEDERQWRIQGGGVRGFFLLVSLKIPTDLPFRGPGRIVVSAPGKVTFTEIFYRFSQWWEKRKIERADRVREKERERENRERERERGDGGKKKVKVYGTSNKPVRNRPDLIMSGY